MGNSQTRKQNKQTNNTHNSYHNNNNNNNERNNNNVNNENCGPTGLYDSCEWDQKIITRLIIDKKLAPRHKGTSAESPDSEECPICFLNYTIFNNVNCCNNYICTECYLQVKSPKEKTICPFCNNPNFAVTFNPAKRKVSSTSVTTPPASPPSNDSSPLLRASPSTSSENELNIVKTPPPVSLKAPAVMSAEDRKN